MRAQLFKWTISPGGNPKREAVGPSSKDRSKLQNEADARNRAQSDHDFDPSAPLITYAVEIVPT